MSLLDFINTHRELKESPEIIFFGGSFNPWHQGHEECVKKAVAYAPIIIIPDNNPFKNYEQNLNRSPSIAKIDQIVNDKNIFLYTGFSDLKKANPTYKWLKNLSDTIPQKLSLLMGFDSFITLHTWFEAPKLLASLSKIYMLSRLDQDDIKEEQRELIHSLNPKLDILFLGNHSFESLSSTKLRD